MKIAVINYYELNKNLSEKNVLDDLIYAYDAADTAAKAAKDAYDTLKVEYDATLLEKNNLIK